ncbi:sigma 54 modulation/S30EA ribosomal C-terminal domain-containing protein [Dactylosporangium sp. NPDC051484]|uniref:sigma 54 modulation/S30EA ribosomal C-terminal domain-containing protein n=1 Tax=Dactylosporangium sp. NPDC051484 TaxID=3154942 RepID=UPI00345045C6
MSDTRTAASAVEVLHRGPVQPEELETARAMFTAVAARHDLTGGVRVRLTAAACSGGPMIVQVNLRVFGAPARIQVPGFFPATALAAGTVRLERQIRRLSTAWEPWPWPDPERRALAVPGQARVTRHKAVRLHRRDSCQAGAYLAAMDYDVYLFTDAETGEEAVVHRAGPTGLQLSRQRSMHPPAVHGTPVPTVNPRRTPVLTPDEAVAHLTEGWLPFLFFTEARTGRGNLLYRRYDGGAGLVTPVE